MSCWPGCGPPSAARPRPPDEPVVKTGDFTVDLTAKRVTRANGSAVRLTPTEWQLLEILVRNRGRLVTQRQLLQEAADVKRNYRSWDRITVRDRHRAGLPGPSTRDSPTWAPDGTPLERRSIPSGGCSPDGTFRSGIDMTNCRRP